MQFFEVFLLALFCGMVISDNNADEYDSLLSLERGHLYSYLDGNDYNLRSGKRFSGRIIRPELRMRMYPEMKIGKRLPPITMRG